MSRQFIGYTILLLALSSCLTSVEPPCTGAAGIDSLHAKQLACIGWLDYVEMHTCQIHYVDIIASERTNTGAYGRANCQDASIMIARNLAGFLGRPEAISTAEQLVTIVHEVAHLEDSCSNGEAPAVATENAFWSEYLHLLKEETAIVIERNQSENPNFDDLCLVTGFPDDL